MKLLIEKTYPYIFGVAASVIWLLIDRGFPENESLLSSTLTVSGIFVGFLATSKAILMSRPRNIHFKPLTRSVDRV